MENFSDNEIKEILGEETAEKKEKNHKVLAAVGIGAVLVAVILAIVIPLSTIKNDEAPDMGGNKHEITPATDFEYSIADGYATINKYIGNGEIIVIPEEIESAAVKFISENAFSDAKNPREIVMPSGITEIGNSTFHALSSLEKVILPDTVVSIGNNAFEGCILLSDITLPSGLKVLGESAFRDCTALSSITIPENVTEIKSYTFLGCSALTSVTLPKGITDIGTKAFSSSGITELTIPENVKAIPGSCFAGCEALTTITLPDALETIGISAFSDTGITSITIPGNVAEIPENCFEKCSKLVSVTFNEGLKTIGVSAFSSCSLIEELSLPKTLEVIGEGAFMRCSRMNKINIQNGVTTIGKEAFANCIYLTEITIPKTATNVNPYKLFYNCSALYKVNFEEGFEKFFYDTLYIAQKTFKGCNTAEVSFPSSFSDENIALIISDAKKINFSIAEDNPYFKYEENTGHIVSTDNTILYYYNPEHVYYDDFRPFYIIGKNISKVHENAFRDYNLSVTGVYSIFALEGCDISEARNVSIRTLEYFDYYFIANEQDLYRAFSEDFKNDLFTIRKQQNFFIDDGIVIIEDIGYGKGKLGAQIASVKRNYADDGIRISAELVPTDTEYIPPYEGAEFFTTGIVYDIPDFIEYRIYYTADYDTEKTEISGMNDFTNYMLINHIDEYSISSSIYKLMKKLGCEYWLIINEEQSFLGYTDLLTDDNGIAYGLSLDVTNPTNTQETYRFEIYPSGYYGEDGAEVHTVSDEKFSFSIRAIDNTGKIHY